MSLYFTVFICLTMVGTSFLSGIFGMAGGLVLVGVLLLVMPVPAAMMLHAVTQMASNGWRAYIWRRHVRWAPVAAYMVGCLIALAIWSIVRYVPSKAVALLLLGSTPFVVHLVPTSMKPDPDNPVMGAVYGMSCMSLMLVTGVAGPLLDSFFLGGRLDRREIVATKGVCQVFGHGLKLVYFGGLAAQTASVDFSLAAFAVFAAMLGTMLSKRFLEAMSDMQFRFWAQSIITVISCYYLAYGGYLVWTSS